MGTRKPPTRDEIMGLLTTPPRDHPNSPYLRTDELGGLYWETAVTYLQIGLRTHRRRADEWLTDEVSAQDSPLIAVWPCTGAAEGARAGLLDRGWTQTNVDALDFDQDERPVLRGATDRRPVHTGPHILLVSQLDAIRATLADE